MADEDLVPWDEWETQFREDARRYNQKPGSAWWNRQIQRRAEADPEGAKQHGVRPAGIVDTPGTASGAGSDQGFFRGAVEGFKGSSIGRGANLLAPEYFGEPTPGWKPEGYLSELGHAVGGAAVPVATAAITGPAAGWIGGSAAERGASETFREMQERRDALARGERPEDISAEDIARETGKGAFEGGLAYVGGKLVEPIARPLSRFIARPFGATTEAATRQAIEVPARLTGYGAGGGTAGGIEEVVEPTFPKDRSKIAHIAERAREGAVHQVGVGLPMELIGWRGQKRRFGELVDETRARRAGGGPPDGGGGGGGGGG